MSAIQKKLMLGGTLLVVAVSYLAYAGMKSGWVYFVEVDQFVTDSELHSQRVRLHGKVGDQNFTADRLDAQFILRGKNNRLNVAYHGVIPDMFKVGGDVVVEGKLDATGTFRADVLMTKCASKYEPQSPHGGGKEKP
jgi:cytochrome c-type biogenesis protein CcmE